MLTVFTSTLTPMLMMFTCILLGYILAKKKLLPESADTTLSKLETFALLPALTISTFMNQCSLESLSSMRWYILAGAGLIILAAVLSYPLSRLFSKGGYERNVYKYALAFGNFGFLGNAVVPIVLGQEYLYPYMLFTLPLTVVCYSWGLALLIPKTEAKRPLWKSFMNPSIFAVVIGVILGIAGAKSFLPDFVPMTLTNLGNCVGPVSMILTGIVTAKYSLKDLLVKPMVYLSGLFRLVLLPAAFAVILILLKVDPTIVKLSLFAFGTPFGLNTVVFPSAYGGDPSTGASMALITHTLCVITIPLLYTVVCLFL